MNHCVVTLMARRHTDGALIHHVDGAPWALRCVLLGDVVELDRGAGPACRWRSLGAACWVEPCPGLVPVAAGIGARRRARQAGREAAPYVTVWSSSPRTPQLLNSLLFVVLSPRPSSTSCVGGVVSVAGDWVRRWGNGAGGWEWLGSVSRRWARFGQVFGVGCCGEGRGGGVCGAGNEGGGRRRG
jgi:hypothetical protein